MAKNAKCVLAPVVKWCDYNTWVFHLALGLLASTLVDWMKDKGFTLDMLYFRLLVDAMLLLRMVLSIFT
jgi:hypothetical protein